MTKRAHAKALRSQGAKKESHARTPSLQSLAYLASSRELCLSSLRSSPPSRPLHEPLPSSSAPRHSPLASRHWPLLAILIAFLALGLAYSAVNPLHEATDELRHYRFVQHLIQRRALPVQGETSGLACTCLLYTSRCV